MIPVSLSHSSAFSGGARTSSYAKQSSCSSNSPATCHSVTTVTATSRLRRSGKRHRSSSRPALFSAAEGKVRSPCSPDFFCSPNSLGGESVRGSFFPVSSANVHISGQAERHSFRRGKGELFLGRNVLPGARGKRRGVVTEASVNDTWQSVEALLATEPWNALSLPTWVIHVSSVIEWCAAILLVWQYGSTSPPSKDTLPPNSSKDSLPPNSVTTIVNGGDVSRSAYKALAWGMLPLLAGAMCACTWHFYYNSPELEILVVLQALFTVIGNCTLWFGAWRIYCQAEEQRKEG